MFRPMRRGAQQLSQADSEMILRRATSGVLSLLGDDGYPYGVPLSHLYHDGKLYFHCAATGHKLDALRACPKASFCAIDRDDVIPHRFTTHYRSVIAFGQVRPLTDPAEIRRAIALLAERFAPGRDPRGEIEDSLPRLTVLEMTVEHLTGKQAVELQQG